MVSNIFYVHPFNWEDSQFDDHIFQMGWFNHQPVNMRDRTRKLCCGPFPAHLMVFRCPRWSRSLPTSGAHAAPNRGIHQRSESHGTLVAGTVDGYILVVTSCWLEENNTPKSTINAIITKNISKYLMICEWMFFFSMHLFNGNLSTICWDPLGSVLLSRRICSLLVW